MATGTLEMPQLSKVKICTEKPLIVVDLDNTLVDMFQGFLTYVYEQFPEWGNHPKGSHKHYDFRDIFPGIDLQLVYKTYNEFVIKHMFHYDPLPGSYEALQQLESEFRFQLLTARNPVVYDLPALRRVTEEWIDTRFPSIFQKVSFCCDYGDLEKYAIVKKLGGVALMDDAAPNAQHTSLHLPILMHEEPWTTEIHELEYINMENVHIFDSWYTIPPLLRKLFNTR